MYDIAVIGAGINGCSIAYELSSAKKNVVVFDTTIANGGSGAAGAFISPKFSKAGELKEILHDAFVYSMEFYEKNFPKSFQKTRLLHIAKDEKDDEILRVYKDKTTLKLFDKDIGVRENISIDSGIVDAQSVCKELLNGIKFIPHNVDTLEFDNGYWIINESYSAKEVVLATGAYKSVIEEPYIKLRGVWGHRIDIETSTTNNLSIHQFVSISPSKDGVIAIGATHNVHYHPETSTQEYDIDDGRAELLKKASMTIKLDDIKIIKDYTGLRSGSFDYMPMIGGLVLSDETLQDKTINFKVKKVDTSKYLYYPNLYMINGSGGYGFVLAPYLAKILKDHILSSKDISDRLTPIRFFTRWAKKL